ncbi:MAG: ATP-binding protein [Bacteroidota bacterium]|nr:ATP-binding protein [Bacteroidota bacterium]
MHISRPTQLSRIINALDHNPVVAIIGARQVGKTTITYEIEKYFDGTVYRFDLEDPEDLARLDEPKLALQNLNGLIIIDEVQRKPEIFPLLRVLVDRRGNDTQFLVLGSASPALLKQSSESLAGRISYQTLSGFTLDEVSEEDATRLWTRGGFPRSFLADSDANSMRWRKNFIRTFLERDIPQMGFSIPSVTLSRFWNMLAHYHAQIWNGSELARAFGISQPSVKRYVDLLTDSLVVWQLKPWFQNISKRQVKAPKVYITDSGILHGLLGIGSMSDLQKHPKIGASWEGFILGEILNQLNIEPSDAYFWSTHTGAELDLLVFIDGKPVGFEIKRTVSPKITTSMKICISDLNLDMLLVIHAGDHEFQMHEKIYAVPMTELKNNLKNRWGS